MGKTKTNKNQTQMPLCEDAAEKHNQQEIYIYAKEFDDTIILRNFK